ncbi:hypothetical protein PAXINDRAFT_167234 [Paxillus involutus ATCC 200175]|nr:hypothetical protein PAXINDRAFT_167234 [Paxillus involutus ATCC 200175]
MENLRPTSPSREPVVILLVSGDQPQSTPLVYHTFKSKHQLCSRESLSTEITRLVSSSSSSSGDSHSRRSTTSSVKSGKIHASFPPMTNKQRKARMWHEALQRKRNGAKMMLAAQQVIEEVEEEIALSVPRNTINKMHSHFFNAGDHHDPVTEAYIATISAVRLEQPASTSESGDCNLDYAA